MASKSPNSNTPSPSAAGPFAATFCPGCGEELMRSGEAYVHVRNNRTACPPSVEAELSRIRTLLENNEELAKTIHGLFLAEATVIVPSWNGMSDRSRTAWLWVADKLKAYLLGEEE